MAGNFYASYPINGGTGVSSLNGLTGALTLVAGTGISITPAGSNITITNTNPGASYTFADSIVNTAGTVTLVNDTATPGNSKYYGTNSGGTLGYFSLPTPGTGTVTSVSVVSANGFAGTVATATSTPAITISTTITGILQGNGTAISAATTGNLTDAGTDGITITNGTGAVLGTGTSIAQHVADTTHNGYLSSTDWNTFNGKQAAGNYITALTGDVTATGPGSVAATLATVNANVGSFGSSTAIPSFTVNGKGLITAASTNAVVAPAGTLTGTTLASNVVTSSLTTVGTIGTGVWNGTTIDVPHGGTNNTSFTAYSIIAAGTTSTGAFQNVSGVGTTGQVLTSNGASALPTWQAATGGTLTAPTITKFTTSTSGTYTTPTSPSPLYLRVIAVGAGAGGGNSGTTIGTLATNGGNTTFGSSLVTANGGVAGTWSNTNGGAGGSGGSGTLGAGAIGFKANGNPGASGGVPANSSATVPGTTGGGSVLGGGGLAAQGNATGGAGIDGTGGGGGGAGLNAVGGTSATGGGGGAGGYVDAIIASPAATYSYAVGAGGTGQTAGTGGQAGGRGGDGLLVIYAFYQ